MKEFMEKVRKWMFGPEDIVLLAYFRIIFGAIMVWEVTRYFDHGWIDRYYVQPAFFFTYPGFGFLEPWSESGMYTHFTIMGFMAGCVCLGLFYRFTSVIFAFMFTYVFLLDKTNYLNHFYLISIVSFAMALLPAHRNFSLDARIWPKIKTDYVPAWTVWTIKLMLGIMYFYGGIAKLNADWLQGMPIGYWILSAAFFSENPGLESLLRPIFEEPWAKYFFAYSGLLLDLLIFPALLFKRTRTIGFILIASFHLMNSQLWSIGIFPWFALAATAIFFPPELFRKYLFRQKIMPKKPKKDFPVQKWAMAFMAVFLLYNCLMPFRHLLYPGNVNWTEEGHKFSWHMKLRDKECEAQFYVYDQKEDTEYRINLENFLSWRQRRKMPSRPDMIVQFAHWIEKVFEDAGMVNVKVTADIWCSLNGRDYQPLVDPTVDLSKVEWSPPNDWIMPLEKPLDNTRWGPPQSPDMYTYRYPDKEQ